MSYFASTRAVLLCIFMSVTGSLYAAEGVTLINQQKAMAGSVTPGDGPGFPVTISKPGSYRLTGNLTVADANTTGILITADHVTLDLNGFGIIGPGLCTDNFEAPPTCQTPGTGLGIRASADQGGGPRSVRVQNGFVRGMGLDGILLTGDGSMVQNVSADGNAQDGFIVNGSVIESSATANGLSGIFAVTVRDSFATANVNTGIQLDGSAGVASGDRSSLNGGAGINAPNATVTGSTVSLNKGVGITTTCPSSIVNNTIVANAGGTITTNNDPSSCVLVNNSVR